MVLNDRAEEGESESGKQTGKRVLIATLVYLGFDVRKFNNEGNGIFSFSTFFMTLNTHMCHLEKNTARHHLRFLFPAVPRVMIFIERSEKNFN